jgi:hypothetical protein
MVSKQNKCIRMYCVTKIAQNCTKTGADTLAACRECKRLPHSHLSYVEVMLADVRCRPLWNKLCHLVTIIGHFA